MLLSTKTNANPFPLLAAFEADPWKATAEHYARCVTDKILAMASYGLELEEEALRTLGIGFSDRSLGNQLPSNQTAAGRRIRERLIQMGLYKENGREALRGYITIPLVDEEHRITGFEGYRLSNSGAVIDKLRVGTGTRLQDSGVRLQEDSIPTRNVSEGQAADTLATETLAPKIPSQPGSPSQEEDPSLTQRVAMQPATPASEISVDASSVTITREDRSYKIRGLEKNMSSLSLRVSIAVSRLERMHLDTVDLMRSSARQAFVKAAALELFCEEETIKVDLGRILLQLEDLRNLQIEAAKRIGPAIPAMTEAQQEEAMQLLRSPNLIERIVHDLDACGMVGEASNKLVGYLAAVSRKLPTPLALLIRSSSAAGKTTLMETILAMVPPEEVLRLSNLTCQSLYYLDSDQLRHKTLAISEDQGLSESAYALKLLQSEGKLTHATVVRGNDGRSVTQLHSVEGPIQLMITSTARDVDEELANRCLILTVDESIEQTKAIQARQRLLQTREGLQRQSQVAAIRTLHHHAQRLLRPLQVLNPLVDSLEFVCDRLRNRRDHAKYLSLIQAIALLHQHQRVIHTEEDGTEWIEVQESDIALADRLMDKLLKQSLSELAPQTEQCLHLVQEFVAKGCRAAAAASPAEQAILRQRFRFTRRSFRESVGWSDNQVRTHLDRLVQLEHLIVHRGKQGATYVYQLAD
ncbi:hypothetical protein VN12_18350 [Pirellula sp. SH-Sr6A]|uniref:hypothetical protein n=1 Tax=Pirellula sp. SH-Sr6A TaxID=1632865 RepID=UPI00078B9263|nr:hypothetical protein [Pirellula sp. SH-Sr6A]AMV32623.1 hypothetical protein VN12_10895 [Pirellula sp. SH-Sr6A]AMV32629.1 hypothetical protein VN12_10925 [Pirellula sp. SH-Sr6A]AMV32635.1 hypothetical protein VN12_10955 [Pirellula sp. SH-Sr6A]AMV34097.1 hypothetical protein VN12_18350 [Pirellula sp. SH-Sr6A]